MIPMADISFFKALNISPSVPCNKSSVVLSPPKLLWFTSVPHRQLTHNWKWNYKITRAAGGKFVNLSELTQSKRRQTKTKEKRKQTGSCIVYRLLYNRHHFRIDCNTHSDYSLVVTNSFGKNARKYWSCRHMISKRRPHTGVVFYYITVAWHLLTVFINQIKKFTDTNSNCKIH